MYHEPIIEAEVRVVWKEPILSEANPNLPTALVVIDAQAALMDGVHGNSLPVNRDAVLESMQRLLANARASGAKVIFIQHQAPSRERMTPGHPGFEVQESIAPTQDETRIVKFSCDSFCDTSLEADLRASGVRHFVACGMQSDYCVDSSARSGLHKGFDVTVAADAHTTWDNEILTGQQIIDHTNGTLPNIPGPGTEIFVKPSADIVFAPAGSNLVDPQAVPSMSVSA
jgi:nicotinamidase-related amidase